MRTNVQFVTPLPPLTSGIAQYSRDLLAAAPGTWPLKLYVEPGSDPSLAGGFPVRDWGSFDAELPSIVQLGNSAQHQAAFAAAMRTRGIVVLHDTVLHHALLGEFIRRNDSRTYVALMGRLYGAHGDAIAQEALRGRLPSDLLCWPLSEPYVRRARAVIVHNAFAMDQVLARTPEARVYRVPMGVPLPLLIDKQSARAALGLPSTAYIVASITHVNPYKRIPVVLRSIRRLAARVPETLFVMAGSISPSINLERQIALLGLRGHVRQLGYVDDVRARLLARAADVCVNLRYPVTGETSASMLRLLGSERPVLVTDGTASDELPEDVGLRIVPDRFEEELLVELLWALADDGALREAAGRAGRAFVEREHTLGVALSGYRNVIEDVFGLSLDESNVGGLAEEYPSSEQLEELVREQPTPSRAQASGVQGRVADALHDTGLVWHAPTISSVARAMVRLGMDTTPLDRSENSEAIDPALLELLACPVCHGTLAQQLSELVCSGCKRRYPIRDGIPDFIDTIDE